MRSFLPWLALAWLTAFPTQAETHIPPPATGSYGVEAEYYILSDALRQSTGLAWAPDGSHRLFVTLQEGQVLIFQDGVLQPMPFITETVVTGLELGLVNLVFDPDFANNHYVYFFASQQGPSFWPVTRILRYTDVGGVGMDRTVIVDDIPANQVHNGGGMAFGPDGLLYFAVGDTGGWGTDEDLTLMSSKINRVHKDGTVPTDNPFYDGPGPNNDYIWARGFRNPFKIRFQPGTAHLWVNVAGQSFEQIFRVGRGDHAGWSQYENKQPDGYLKPVVAYNSQWWEEYWFAETGAVRKDGVATFTVIDDDYMPVSTLRQGKRIHVRDVRDPSFNGVGFITGFPSPHTFTMAQPGPDAVSGGGTLKTDPMGNVLVGGTFCEGPLFPPEYQGNYFFADMTGNVFRAVLRPDGSVDRVDFVVIGSIGGELIDLAMGPDGALYVLPYSGGVLRITPVPPELGLVLSSQDLVIPEGGSKTVTVSLAAPPTKPLTITAQPRRQEDFRVSEGSVLQFDATNWSVPQFVTISANQDADADIDHGTIFFSLYNGFPDGFPGRDIRVRTSEDEIQALQLSASSLDFEEGTGGSFTVALAYAPTVPVTITVAHTSGSEDVSITEGESLTFTPEDGTAPKTVTVATARDSDSDDDLAVLTVSAPGMEARAVTVTARDVAGVPVITSAPVTEATVGEPYAYSVTATGRPVPILTLEQGPEGMTLDAESGLLSWEPLAETTVGVSIRAHNGQTPDAVQTFQLKVQLPGAADAGTDLDGGGVLDAGPETDAGTDADAGTVSDAGPEFDAGTVADAGHGLDAGTAHDAGTGPDGMENESGGCGCGATAMPGVLGWWLLTGLVWKTRRARR
ncbi:PQQ-dependent sugar dehydrogenase [Corallococcus sp. bb12-1]|uniref:PQQ-dependent sugar dehydrogenase n=1 Tax=Corallococcus sp. bb12-1 TaxID=2996784 RepID=UPI002270C18B|nr:PQQ-dependent sugar dehydrogenase [Corallococcus sp. bb12-1]MCY1041895.1 PQQ-dependent sugar dehydrogenase [Corallococcus sp. bb12-1]